MIGRSTTVEVLCARRGRPEPATAPALVAMDRRRYGALCASGATDDPAIRLVLERALDESRPGSRSDEARIALAIEGGGMAGAVSGGMCVGLEALGLLDSFDVIYGSSAGSMNASYLAARQARARWQLYPLAAERGLIDARRALRGRPPFRLAEIIHSLMDLYPHDRAVLDGKPDIRLTASRVEDKQLNVLGAFQSLDELRTAVWASASIPVLAGDVVEFRGVSYVDGGLLESVPFRVALREGATHVVVLRSRNPWYRKRELTGWRLRALDRVLKPVPETVREMIHERPARYNADACDLQHAPHTSLSGRVVQLTPPAGTPCTSQVESDPRKLRTAIALGVRTVLDTFTAPARDSAAA